jgi:DnaJ-class molecular chaperone
MKVKEVKMNDQQKCIACHGEKIQTKNDGVRIVCPVCKGTGKKTIQNETTTFQDKFGVSDSVKILIE